MLSYRNPMEHLYSPFLELKLFNTFCYVEIQVIIVPLVGYQPIPLVRLWRVCEGPLSRIILTCVCKVEVSTCVVPEVHVISMIASRFPFLQCRFKYSLPGASDGQPGCFPDYRKISLLVSEKSKMFLLVVGRKCCAFETFGQMSIDGYFDESVSGGFAAMTGVL